jgi:hypothetical protein
MVGLPRLNDSPRLTVSILALSQEPSTQNLAHEMPEKSNELMHVICMFPQYYTAVTAYY